MLEDLIALLKDASTSAVNDAALLRGSQWIDALKREYPAAHFFILGLLYKTPSEVLMGLAKFNRALEPYTTNEHALAYIGALQVKLRGKKCSRCKAFLVMKDGFEVCPNCSKQFQKEH